jgi:fumarate reductase subunit D
MGTQLMEPSAGERFVLPGVVRTTGALSVALGALALLGWAIANDVLKRLAPGLPSMRPMTAVGVILLGIAVSALLGSPVPRWTGLVAAVGAGLIGGASLLEYLLGVSLPTDHLMFRGAVDHEEHGGRMALATAVGLVLLVLAVLAVFLGKRRIAQGLGLAAFTGAAIAVLGYAYGARRLYATNDGTGMALNTALSLTLASLGVLAAVPGGALVHLFRRPAPGALPSRRLLPWIVIVMPVIGWLRIEGERRGLFDTAFGTSIMVFAGSLLVAATARLAVVSMDRLAYSLNHAWYQYGLASAGQHVRPHPGPPPPLDDLHLDADEAQRNSV